MFINPNIHSMIKTYMNQQAKSIPVRKAAAKAGAAEGTDKTEFSQEGKFLLNALQGAKDLPEVRPEKVAALKDAIRTGTYTVNDDALAEKLIEAKIFDKLI